MIIRDLPKHYRPREKALQQGIESLHDYELLAMILRSGTKGQSVLSLAQEILIKYPLNRLADTNYLELMSFKGVKEAKAFDLLACFELSKRISHCKIYDKDIIRCPKDLITWMQLTIGTLSHEQFLVVNLDVKNSVINHDIIFKGTLDLSVVHPREIFKFAIVSNAAKIICAHNHPSGNPTPSKQDIVVTNNLRAAGDLLGIALVDHIVIVNHDYHSIVGELKK